MDTLLPSAWTPSPSLLAAAPAQGIDLALCAVVPVPRSRPHLFGEEKVGSVVPNRGGIHGQALGAGSPAWYGPGLEEYQERERGRCWGRALGSCLCPWSRALSCGWVKVQEEGDESPALLIFRSEGGRAW